MWLVTAGSFDVLIIFLVNVLYGIMTADCMVASDPAFGGLRM